MTSETESQMVERAMVRQCVAEVLQGKSPAVAIKNATLEIGVLKVNQYLGSFTAKLAAAINDAAFIYQNRLELN